MTEHHLKTWPEYFQDIVDGKKGFEARREDDRRFEVGDVLVLQEWDPHPSGQVRGAYTGREVRVRVTYLLRGDGEVGPEGYVVMQIEPAPVVNEETADRSLWRERQRAEFINRLAVHDGRARRVESVPLTTEEAEALKTSFEQAGPSSAVLAHRPPETPASTQELVRQFHEACGFHIGQEPSLPPDQIRFERALLVAEEGGEFETELIAGLSLRQQLAVRDRFLQNLRLLSRGPDLPKTWKEMGDLDYVLNGGAVNYCAPLARITAAVHDSNMAKVIEGDVIDAGDGKAGKPEKWVPPPIERVVADWWASRKDERRG